MIIVATIHWALKIKVYYISSCHDEYCKEIIIFMLDEKRILTNSLRLQDQKLVGSAFREVSGPVIYGFVKSSFFSLWGRRLDSVDLWTIAHQVFYAQDFPSNNTEWVAVSPQGLSDSGTKPAFLCLLLWQALVYWSHLEIPPGA